MTPSPARTWPRLSAIGLSALCLLALGAGSALMVGPASASPEDAGAIRGAELDPAGILIGPRCSVRVFTEGWHGSAEAPFTEVLGAFRLETFPYGSPGNYSSVCFLRSGSYAYHAPVRAPAPAQRERPHLGKVLLRPLLPGQAGLTVVVAADGPRPGLRSYLEAVQVRVTPRAGGEPLEGKTRAGEARFGLAPGAYLVYVEGAEQASREVVLAAEQGECLLFRLP